MPEVTGTETVTTPTTGTEPSADEVKAFLTEFGFTIAADARKALLKYKEDVTQLKGEAKGKSEIEKELETLRAEAEQRRQATLSETEKAKEENAKLLKEIAERDGEIQKRDKLMTMKDVMHEALKDKPLATVRQKLYQAAASSQEWDGAEALKSILKQVDTDLEADFKALNVTLPAPGDGAGTGGGTGGGEAGKYDEAYFERLKAKPRGVTAR